MENKGFEDIKRNFESAPLDEKINIYVNTENLTMEQYKELLKMYPLNELHRLESALSGS